MTANAETITWGYYDGTDLSQFNCVGMGQAAAYDVAMKVSGSGVFGGTTLEALNLPVVSSKNMKDITVWVADVNMAHLSEVSVDKNDLTNASYNTITLTDKVTIPAEGVYVGASFTISKATSNADKFPIYFDASNADADEALLLKEGNAWTDYTSQFGAYVMQIVVSGVQLSNASAYCEPLANAYTTPGNVYEFPVTLCSDGGVAVSSIEYVVDFDGKQETRTADVQVPSGINKKGVFNVSVTGPAEVGSYSLKMNVTKVNGEPNDKAGQVTETIVSNVERLAVRRTVVEEFTGTGCGYCPRGLQGMDNMKKAYGDRFVGIGIHQYNSSDPMYNGNYANLGFSGAPSCIIDRKEIMDPYYGSSTSVLDDFERYNSIIAPVDVALTAYWQEGANFEEGDINVDLTATVAALSDDNYTIAFVLTADSLIGSANSWKQSNYYSSESNLPDDLKKFGRGGEYGKSSFFYAFDDVLIASSYSGTRNKAEALGAMKAGDEKVSTYTLSLPTKATLLNAILESIDKVYGIAIVLTSKGEVANAIRVRVTDASGQGIHSVEADAPKAPAMRYSLDGHQVAEGQKGFTVVRMSDGTVRKELR